MIPWKKLARMSIARAKKLAKTDRYGLQVGHYKWLAWKIKDRIARNIFG